MGLIVVLVFLGVFTIVALPLIAGAMMPSKQAKQVLASLDSALATESREAREQILSLRKQEMLSSIPWLNRRLLKLELAPMLQSLLDQADVKWTIGTLLGACGVCFALPVCVIYLRFNNLLLALPVGLAVGAAPILWVLNKRTRRFAKFLEQLPEAIDLMVNGLRAGHSLIAAMGLVARECPNPVGSEFNICFEEQNYGLEIKSAIDNLLNRVPIQDLRIVGTAIMIQKESGGNLAEVLDKTAYAIRERFRLRRQVMVHTAQGRMTGWILTLLPIGLGAALYGVNPAMMSVLWTRPIGRDLLWVAAGMMAIGAFIIRQIVNMDV